MNYEMYKLVYKRACPCLNQSGTQYAFPQFHAIGEVRSCTHDISDWEIIYE